MSVEKTVSSIEETDQRAAIDLESQRLAEQLDRAIKCRDVEGVLILADEMNEQSVRALRHCLALRFDIQALKTSYLTSDPCGVPILLLDLALRGG